MAKSNSKQTSAEILRDVMTRTHTAYGSSGITYRYELLTDAQAVLMTQLAPSEALADQLSWTAKGFGFAARIPGLTFEDRRARQLAWGAAGDSQFVCIHDAEGAIWVLQTYPDGTTTFPDKVTGQPVTIQTRSVCGYRRFSDDRSEAAVDYHAMLVGAQRMVEEDVLRRELATSESGELVEFLDEFQAAADEAAAVNGELAHADADAI